jgi:predicted nuclease of predicted toxin-antitoxin system
VKLCLDEHYSPQIAEALRRAGHDVTSVKERPELVSLSDDDLLATMQAEQRALLTENVADFAPLIATRGANGQSHHGIVYTSNSSMPRSKETIGIYVRALTELLEAHPADDDFVDTVHWL